MILNPLAALLPALESLLPSLGARAGAAGASGGLSGFLRGLFAPSSGSALSAGEIEEMLAEGLFSNASGIFDAPEDASFDVRTGAIDEEDNTFDVQSGALVNPAEEAARAAAESAREARNFRRSHGGKSGGGKGGGGFSGVALDGLLGGGGGDLSEMLGGGLVAGAIGAGVSKAGDTASALFSAPFQVANSIIPDGSLKGAAASGLGALGGLGSAAWSGIKGDPAGWVRGMTQFTTGVIDATKQLKDFAEGTAEANRRHGRFSPDVAYADAQLEVGRLRRDMELAQQTGGTASATIDSQNRLEDSLKEFNQAMSTLLNLASIGINEALRTGVELAKWSPVIQAVGRVAATFEKGVGGADPNMWVEFRRGVDLEAKRRLAEQRRREKKLD